MNTPAIAIHGGSGIITESLKKPEIKKYFQTLQQALDGGFAMLTDNTQRWKQYAGPYASLKIANCSMAERDPFLPQRVNIKWMPPSWKAPNVKPVRWQELKALKTPYCLLKR